ncbi:MAG: DUF3344 domain-containing protein [Methanobacterium sp.]|nr:DUF3344 domain-containing protein [Methanobacterium sp.]
MNKISPINRKNMLFLTLTVLFVLVLSGAASAGTPLQENQTGTVSGDLYVNTTDGWPSSTLGATNEVTQANTLPAYTSIDSAWVYVNVYSGSGSANWPVRTTVKIDGNGDGDYDDPGELLGVEDMNIPGSTDGTVYWLNDHCNRVYSDYQVWYDVTSLITCNNPTLYVKTENMGGTDYDGRIKLLALTVAYNDGDTDQVHYWVLNGQDWINTATSPSTSTFNTSGFNGQVSSATLNTVALSGTDGTYNLNGTTLTGNLTETGTYYKEHQWDVTSNINTGTNTTLTYANVGSSLKMNLATLTIREEYTAPPIADFTADTTSGFEPLTVNFTDNSTGFINSWAWDFNNDDVTDSNVQNPTYTYTIPGTYTVKLTLTGPGGTVSETKTNYIAVIPHNYATMLGGSGAESGTDIKVDDDGNIYITGQTASTNFPTTSNAYQTTNAGGTDAYLVKFNSSGTLMYSTYLGGSGNDYGSGIIVDTNGNIYITGYTASTNFPTTSNAYQNTNAGSDDLFLAKFNSNGDLTYSTYLGGSGSDKVGYTLAGVSSCKIGGNIAIDNDGNVYITGYTSSTDFPTTVGAYQTSKAGYDDIFVSKFNSSGNLVYSTYLGGSSSDDGFGIAVDCNGNAYITGYTDSTNFPITPGAYQATKASPSGGFDIFVTKLNSEGTALIYSTYLGGSANSSPVVTASSYGIGIALSEAGDIYITGRTTSSNFPTTIGAYQTNINGVSDVVVTKFDPAGSLVFSTYLGGGGDTNTSEYGHSIVIDKNGYVYIGGRTNSTNFPTTPGAYRTTKNPGSGAAAHDAFISKFDSNGNLIYSTYYGGSGSDMGTAIDVDNEGNVYITGYDNYTALPTTPGAFQPASGGSSDAFFGKLDIRPPVADFNADRTFDYVPLTVHFTDQSTNGTPTAWAWDFDNDGTVDSTEQNPTWIYNTTGVYTVKLTASNVGGSNSITKTDYITVNPLPDDHEAPNVTVNPASGTYTSRITVTLSATDNYDPYPVVYYTTDGSDPTTNSAMYTIPIIITENTTLKFISADRFGNIGTVQTELYNINDTESPTVVASPIGGNYNIRTLITLSAADNADLNPTIYYTLDGTDPTTNSQLYNGPIDIYQTTNLTLKFISVDKSGNISPVQTEIYHITDNEAPTADATQNGTNITLSATDNMDSNPIIYYTTDGTDPTTNSTPYSDPITIPLYSSIVVKFIAVDVSGNISPVQTRNFNTYTGDPWNGGRYYNGTDLETEYYVEGNVGLAMAQYGGYGWFAYPYPNSGTGTATFTPSDLNIPEGAIILTARLYQAWTWYGNPGYTLNFNGTDITTPLAHYVDQDDGQDIYDVTPYFNTTGNNVAVLSTHSTASYATILIVVYQSATQPYRKIWIDEGYDVLQHQPATGFAMFNNVTTSNVSSAQMITITPSGQGDTGSILFNGQTILLSNAGGSDPSLNYYNVVPALQNGTNELGVYGGSYMALQNAILTLTMNPVAAFTADVVSGFAPLTVQFTDQSTDATGYAWDFDNNGTVDSTEQNPLWSFAAGTYTVKLTVTGPGGSDEEIKTDLISVDPSMIITNVRTNLVYTSIQDAIEDVLTMDGDTLIVHNGTYTENVFIDKQLTFNTTGVVTVNPANPDIPIFSISSTGSGTSITGFNLTGATNSAGIRLYSADNCQISGNSINNNFMGIKLYKSTANTINGNTITNNNWTGICLDQSTANIINGNEIAGNLEGLYIVNSSNNNLINSNNIHNNINNGVDILSNSTGNSLDSNILSHNAVIGLFIQNSSTNTITNNTVQNNGWVGICLDNATGNTISNSNEISNNTEGVYLANNSNSNLVAGNNIHNNTNNGIDILNNSTGNTIDSNTLSNNGVMGLFIQNSNTNTISANTVQNNGWVGICLDNATGNTINNGNEISNNIEGVYIVNGSASNTLSGNNIQGNSDIGVAILNSNSNTIAGSQIKSNGVIGVFARNSNGTVIHHNTIESNGWGGVILDTARNTSVYQNNFINNPLQAYAVNGEKNNFNKRTNGNYWSDWTSNEPRPIDGNEPTYDHYPSRTTI